MCGFIKDPYQKLIKHEVMSITFNICIFHIEVFLKGKELVCKFGGDWENPCFSYKKTAEAVAL